MTECWSAWRRVRLGLLITGTVAHTVSMDCGGTLPRAEVADTSAKVGAGRDREDLCVSG